MPRAITAALAVALLSLFLLINRAAYKSWFSDDDLDNIGWTRQMPAASFAAGLLSPQYQLHHFRPVGHATFAALSRTAGLDFRWYVALSHALHFICVGLLCLLLRSLGVPHWASAAGAVFFLFQMALFQALWRPMYVFDLWCALFSLATLLAWRVRRYWLALLFFWLAVKSKEHAVMLVPALAAHEWLLGQRRWRNLAPFAALGGMYAAQGAFANRGASTDYTLRFSVAALATTVSFYLSRVLIVPYLAPLLAAAPILIRDPRITWGCTVFVSLLAPMLVLPGRLFSAYLYAPMIGVAIMAAATAARIGWPAALAAALLWLPLNLWHLRRERNVELAIAAESRAYGEEIAKLPQRMPATRRFIYDGYPKEFRPWGIQGALRQAYRTMDLEVLPADSKELRKVLSTGSSAVLTWDAVQRRVIVDMLQPGAPDRPYLEAGRLMPVWQLGDGWYPAEGAYRWIKPHATARLYRPAGARVFEMKVNIGPMFIGEVEWCWVQVLIDGVEVGTADFREAGWRTVRFAIEPKPSGPVEVEFRVKPEYRPSNGDPRVLGVPIGAFGFRE